MRSKTRIWRGVGAAWVAMAMAGCATRDTRTQEAPEANAPIARTEVAAPAAPLVVASSGAKAEAGRPAVTTSAGAGHVVAGGNGVKADGDYMTVHTLPVGAGNCQLLDCPSQNKLIMFDCGSLGTGTRGWTAAEVHQYVDNLIDNNTVVVVSISHTDADHNNYLPDVFDDITVSDIVFARAQGDYSQAVYDWMEQQEEDGADLIWWNAEYTSAAPEDELSCFAPDGGGSWDVDVAGYILAVNAGNTANDASMVIGEIYGDFQIVFTADMTATTEADIADDDPIDLIDTDVITGAHHGADTYGSNSQEWVDATQADLVMFSAGTRHLHPRCDSVDRYLPYLFTNADAHDYDCGDGGVYVNRNTTDAVLVTDVNGLITVQADGQGGWEYNWDPDAQAASIAARLSPHRRTPEKERCKRRAVGDCR